MVDQNEGRRAGRDALTIFAGFARLEDDLGGKLQLTGRECTGDLAEARSSKRAVRRRVIDLVQDVECLRAEIEVRRVIPQWERFM